MTQQSNGPAVATPPSTEMTIVPQASETSFRRRLEPDNLDQAYKLATVLAQTKYCGVATPEEALARLMFGAELGLTSMQSIRAVYVVNGRPGLDATVMLALCLNHPTCEYFEPVESTAKIATYRAKRKGRPEVVLSWTIAQADTAGLLGGKPKGEGKNAELTKPKDNWVNYPENMLRARCIANLARMVFPEAINGMHLPEELDGEAVARPPAPADYEVSVVKTVDRMEELALDLKKAIANVRTPEDKKAIRQRIAEAEKAAVLSGPWLAQVKEAYNARKLGNGATAAASASAAVAPPAADSAPAETGEVVVPADASDAWEPGQ